MDNYYFLQAKVKCKIHEKYVNKITEKEIKESEEFFQERADIKNTLQIVTEEKLEYNQCYRQLILPKNKYIAAFLKADEKKQEVIRQLIKLF